MLRERERAKVVEVSAEVVASGGRESYEAVYLSGLNLRQT